MTRCVATWLTPQKSTLVIFFILSGQLVRHTRSCNGLYVVHKLIIQIQIQTSKAVSSLPLTTLTNLSSERKVGWLCRLKKICIVNKFFFCKLKKVIEYKFAHEVKSTEIPNYTVYAHIQCKQSTKVSKRFQLKRRRRGFALCCTPSRRTSIESLTTAQAPHKQMKCRTTRAFRDKNTTKHLL